MRVAEIAMDSLLLAQECEMNVVAMMAKALMGIFGLRRKSAYVDWMLWLCVYLPMK